MDTKPGKSSSGILRSIKRLIFEDGDTGKQQPPENVPEQPGKTVQEPVPDVLAPAYVSPAVATGVPEPADLKEMKARVLDLLEKLNEDGLDFFEVWNAAAEMGTIDAASIKAAFTSLKYVDKSLTRDKLLQTGRSYAAKIREVIDQDVAQKQRQKEGVQNDLVKERQSLQTGISDLETKIKGLQEQLADQQKQFTGLDGKYESRLKEIDNKISTGKAAVEEVVEDIEKAISIIEKNIN